MRKRERERERERERVTNGGRDSKRGTMRLIERLRGCVREKETLGGRVRETDGERKRERQRERNREREKERGRKRERPLQFSEGLLRD